MMHIQVAFLSIDEALATSCTFAISAVLDVTSTTDATRRRDAEAAFDRADIEILVIKLAKKKKKKSKYLHA